MPAPNHFIKRLHKPANKVDNLSILGVIYGAHSTDELLKLFRKGKMQFLQNLNGHFVLIIDDWVNQKSYVINDRFNTYPVHFKWDKQNKTILCSNRIKSIVQDSGVLTYNLNGVFSGDYKDYGDYFESSFEGIFTLKGGRYIEFDHISKRITITCYWDLISRYSELQNTESNRSKNDWIAGYRDCLGKAVHLRTNSKENKLLLSGGLDSNSILSLMGNKEVETYNLLTELSLFNGECERISESVNKSNVTNKGIAFKSSESCISSEYWYNLMAATEHPEASFDAYFKSIVLDLAKNSPSHTPCNIITGLGSDELNGGKLLRFIRTNELDDPDSFSRFLRKMKEKNSLIKIDPAARQFFKPGFYEHSQEKGCDDSWALYLYEMQKDNALFSQLAESKISLRHNCHYTYPFLDANLVDYTLSIPKQLHSELLLDKQILKDAMVDYLPPLFKDYTKRLSGETPLALKIIATLYRSILYSDNFALIKRCYESSDFVKENLEIDAVLSSLKNTEEGVPDGYIDILRVINCGIIESNFKQDEPIELSRKNANSLSFVITDVSRQSQKEITHFLDKKKYLFSFDSVYKFSEDIGLILEEGKENLHILKDNELLYTIDDPNFILVLTQFGADKKIKSMLKELGINQEDASPLFEELFNQDIIRAEPIS